MVPEHSGPAARGHTLPPTVSALRVLVVEDDEAIARGVSSALSSEGYDVTPAATFADASTFLADESFALVLLDLALPDGDGVELCRELRRRGNPAPVIMLTARQHEADVVLGLDAGANDYIVKPFRLA